MPITKSAKKALRQSKTRHARNLVRATAYKSSVKEFRKLIAAQKFAEAKAMLPRVYQTLDKAAKTGIIKANKAGRLKSSAQLSVAQK